MTTRYDLAPAAAQLARLTDEVDDDQMSAETPCQDWPVAVLLAHLLGLTAAFTAAASKAPFQPTPPSSTGICPPTGMPSCTSASTRWSSRGARPRHGRGRPRPVGSPCLPRSWAWWPSTSSCCTAGTWRGVPISHSTPIRPACRRAWASPPRCPSPVRRPAARGSTARSCPSRTMLPTSTGCSASPAGIHSGRRTGRRRSRLTVQGQSSEKVWVARR